MLRSRSSSKSGRGITTTTGGPSGADGGNRVARGQLRRICQLVGGAASQDTGGEAGGQLAAPLLLGLAVGSVVVASATVLRALVGGAPTAEAAELTPAPAQLSEKELARVRVGLIVNEMIAGAAVPGEVSQGSVGGGGWGDEHGGPMGDGCPVAAAGKLLAPPLLNRPTDHALQLVAASHRLRLPSPGQPWWQRWVLQAFDDQHNKEALCKRFPTAERTEQMSPAGLVKMCNQAGACLPLVSGVRLTSPARQPTALSAKSLPTRQGCRTAPNPRYQNHAATAPLCHPIRSGHPTMGAAPGPAGIQRLAAATPGGSRSTVCGAVLGILPFPPCPHLHPVPLHQRVRWGVFTGGQAGRRPVWAGSSMCRLLAVKWYLKHLSASHAPNSPHLLQCGGAQAALLDVRAGGAAQHRTRRC